MIYSGAVKTQFISVNIFLSCNALRMERFRQHALPTAPTLLECGKHLTDGWNISDPRASVEASFVFHKFVLDILDSWLQSVHALVVN